MKSLKELLKEIILKEVEVGTEEEIMATKNDARKKAIDLIMNSKSITKEEWKNIMYIFEMLIKSGTEKNVTQRQFDYIKQRITQQTGAI